MAERAHSLHELRELPGLLAQALRAALGIVCTTVAVIWLEPTVASLALALSVTVIAVPLLLQRALVERDLKLRTHTGAISRFYLDALLGVVPVRTHGVARAVRREHERLLVEWTRAGLSVHRAGAYLDALQALFGFGLAAALVVSAGRASGDPASLLLLAYWTLTLPVLGEELAVAMRGLPKLRNLALRALEPLGAPEQPTDRAPRPEASAAGAAISFQGVAVHVGGHPVLEAITLTLAPGEHVAVVGSSGAGKSTLIGLLLGFHVPHAGTVLVDGSPLDGESVPALRDRTAWLDPTVQLWNQTLVENLRYGAVDPTDLGTLVEASGLSTGLERLPAGLQTLLGEGGGLVSGGEGQRVRLGRALHRANARLALLDEPFRGLDRPARRALLQRARARFRDATLICVTHDVRETAEFPRVLVLDGGRVVEDGSPTELARRPGGHYAALLEAEREAEARWRGPHWRRMEMREGRLPAAGGIS
jgi:ATP-binding cassette subfamily B protein